MLLNQSQQPYSYHLERYSVTDFLAEQQVLTRHMSIRI